MLQLNLLAVFMLGTPTNLGLMQKVIACVSLVVYEVLQSRDQQSSLQRKQSSLELTSLVMSLGSSCVFLCDRCTFLCILACHPNSEKKREKV